MFTESQSADLLRVARVYARAKNVSLATIGTYAVNHGHALHRLEEGKGITVGRLNRMMQWLSDHWPEQEPWPSGVNRPKRRKKREAA
jgi:hypothetical protein